MDNEEVMPDDGHGLVDDDFSHHKHSAVRDSMQRKMSLFNSCMLLVCSIGVNSIFIALSSMLRYTGSIAVTSIVLILSGLLNLSLARCFTEVAIILPKSGGPYYFLFEVYGGFLAFLFMWGFAALIILPVWAITAYTSALYIVQLCFQGCRPPDDAIKFLSLCIIELVSLHDTNMEDLEKETVQESESLMETEVSPKVEIEVELPQHKKLTLFDSNILLVCSIGSSGLFIAMSSMLQYTGSVALTLIILLISGLLNLSLSRCFMEVAIMLPKSGGPYFFLFEVYGGFASFLFMWGFISLIVTPVWALLTYTSALYIVQLFFPGCRPPDDATKFLSLCILVLIVGLNCMYMKYVTKVQTFLSLSKIVAMLIIIIGGAIKLAQGEVENFLDVFEGSTKEPGDVALSILAGMFFYGGWQLITFLLEEMKDPEKHLPKALGFSFFVVILLNELTVAAYFVLLSPKEMLSADAVAVLFMERLYFPLAPAISVFVTTTSVGALNGVVLAHSRLIYAAAKNGHMPSIFATLNKQYFMPWAATMLLCILSILVLITGTLMELIEMVSFYAVVMSLAVLMCFFTLRWQRPDAHRPINVWLVTAIFQFILNLAVLLMCIYQKPAEMGKTVLIICCGIPVYVIGVAWRSKPKIYHRIMQKTTIVLQKLFLLEHAKSK